MTFKRKYNEGYVLRAIKKQTTVNKWFGFTKRLIIIYISNTDNKRGGDNCRPSKKESIKEKHNLGRLVTKGICKCHFSARPKNDSKKFNNFSLLT